MGPFNTGAPQGLSFGLAFPSATAPIQQAPEPRLCRLLKFVLLRDQAVPGHPLLNTYQEFPLTQHMFTEQLPCGEPDGHSSCPQVTHFPCPELSPGTGTLVLS